MSKYYKNDVEVFMLLSAPTSFLYYITIFDPVPSGTLFSSAFIPVSLLRMDALELHHTSFLSKHSHKNDIRLTD